MFSFSILKLYNRFDMTNKVFHDSESPANGKQVITACVFIHKNFDGIEKVFVSKRADTKKFLPGVFELPGGHIDFGEDMIDGLKREIKEEFGMDIKVGDPFYTFTYLNEIKGSHSIEVIYFATFSQPNKNIKLNSEDHSEYRWIGENELEQIVTSNKRGDDPEIKAIQKGFSLLNGNKLDFS